jgi:hypothetical protein
MLRRVLAAVKTSGVTISSSRRANSASVRRTRFRASNFSRKLRSSAARSPNRLFFPTLHIHDGQVHDKELFDHTLYFQATRGPLHGGWEESPGLPVTKVKCGLTHGMVRPDMHLYRHQMIGKFTNGDVVVDLPAA